MGYTDKQLQAINTTDTNILVSAGAGSGKTTVLSARVMRILKQGHSIPNMLILTFTNNAAHNMREKIKKDIKKNLKEYPELIKQYKLVDTADILTFDAYNQKLLKRYFYRLGISKDFSIIDSSLMNVELSKIIRAKLDSLYEEKNETFLGILDKYTVKNDSDIFGLVQSIVKEEQKLPDWREDLEKKIADPYLSNSVIDNAYDLIVSTMKEEIEGFLKTFDACFEGDKAYEDIKLNTIQAFSNYNNIKTVEDGMNMYSAWTDMKLRKKKGDSDFKPIYDKAKKAFKSSMDKYKGNFPTKARTAYILQQKKEDTIFLYKIALDIIEDLNKYKRTNQVYDFFDIANYALSLLRDNDDIRCEVRDSYFEIMVDEYQDNSDLQEDFIRLIGNNNLFMVGDVKQSIYRFRNAKPEYFMRRYALYQKGKGGVLIDMNDNFRSTPSVIKDINEIFSKIMFEDFGGADYAASHKINARNISLRKVDNLHTKQFNYTFGSRPKLVSKFEARIICEDIIRRVDSKELVGADQHPAKFSDFCLLCDRGSKFEEIAKIFKEYKIPLKVETNKEVSDQIIVLLIKSLFNLYLCVENKDYSSATFKHALLSITRSAFCKYSQEELNSLFLSNNYAQDPTVLLMKEICAQTKGKDIKTIFLALTAKFHVYKSIKDFVSPSATYQFLQVYESIIDSMAKLKYKVVDVANYFETLKAEKIQVQLSINSASTNSVILTNIHKSKGLEYPIVYFIGIVSKYHINQYTRGFYYSQSTGIVLPFIKDEFLKERETAGIQECPSSPLLEAYRISETSQDYQEKIRLLYVALTRTKYQMIFVEPATEYVPGSLTLKRAKSFLDLLNFANFIGGIKSFSKDDLNMKPYVLNKEDVSKLPVEFKYRKIDVSYEVEDKKTASKGEKTNADKSLLEFGTYVHKIMESIDFDNPIYDYIEDEQVKKIARNFVESDLMKKYSQYQKYPEYEYFDSKLQTLGSVDLLLVGKSDLAIVDYKLKHIDDEAYVRQLGIYKENMEKIFNKPAKCYLYSLIDSTYKEIC